MRLLLLSLLLPSTVLLHAQEALRPARNTGLWTSFGVKADAPAFLKDVLGEDRYKRLDLAAETGFRTGDELADGNQLFFDGSARYKIADWIDVGIEQRIAFRNGERNRHRSGVRVSMEKKVDRVELDYRFIYQHNYRPWGERREVLRNRFGVSYNIPDFKYDPELTMEFFTWAGFQGMRYTGVRYRLGTDIKIIKDHELGLAVIHDRDTQVSWPGQRWIASMSYTIDLR
ncbi:MAG: DUF2490 domain-containing protein [Flavobacteriales bacterium]